MLLPYFHLGLSLGRWSSQNSTVKLFLYEYTCATISSDPGALALFREGWAMLSSLQEDFAGLPGVETVALLDEQCGRLPSGAVHRVRERAQEEAAFRDLSRAADYTLVIAPEFDNILCDRCRWIEEAGGRSLGSSLAAIRLAGDKLE